MLCFDSDAAGQKAAERSLAVLLEANVTVRVATMPAGRRPRFADPPARARRRSPNASRAAQDFFDFQIERLARPFDLNTPRGKTQFSREMAESVALLTDTVLREAVVGKVSARLGHGGAGFPRAAQTAQPAGGRAACGGPARGRRGGEDGEPADAPAFEKPPKVVSDLLKIALENEEARRWLLDQPWEEVLPQSAGADLLHQRSRPSSRPATRRRSNAFLATLPAGGGSRSSPGCWWRNRSRSP